MMGSTKRKGIAIGMVLALTCALFMTMPANVSSAGNTLYVDDGGGADYTNIQDAIDAANSNDTIYVYNGDYNEQIIVNKSITIEGESNVTTIVHGGFKLIQDNITIKNLKIINGYVLPGSSGNGDNKAGIYATSSFNTFTNNYITEIVGGDGASINPYCGGDGGKAIGIYLNTSNYNTISSNTITALTSGSGGPGMPFAGIGGIAAGIYLNDSNNNTIISNSISIITGGDGGYVGMGIISSGGVAAGIYILHSNDTIVNANSFSTITGGNSAKGIAIYLYSSNDNIVDSNSISSISGGDGVPGGPANGGNGGMGASIFICSSNSNAITNNTITSIYGGHGGSAHGIASGGTGGNSIGIYLLNSEFNTVNLNDISIITGGNGGVSGGHGGPAIGIYLDSSNLNTVNSNILSQVSGGKDASESDAASITVGIYLHSSEYNTIMENTISTITGGEGSCGLFMCYKGGSAIGIYLELNSNSTTISLNTITSITGGKGGEHMFTDGGEGGYATGLHLDKSNQNLITSNHISDVMGGNGGNAPVDHGGNGGDAYGLYPSSSDYNTISSNTIFSVAGGDGGSGWHGPGGIDWSGIDGSGYGAFVTTTSNDNILYHNNFGSNNQNAQDEGISNTWYYGGEGNYWDDYSGIDSDNNGIGDTPYSIPGVTGSQDNYPLMSPLFIWVDDDFDASTFGWGFNHFDSIQNGINAVNKRGTVHVYNGVYSENIVVDKTLNLTGESRDGVIIDGGSFGDVICISADWVNISGLTVTNSGAVHPDAGIKVDSANYCSIENINASDNHAGMYLYYADNCVINNNFVTNNLEQGILSYWSNSNEFGHNYMYNNSHAGIQLAAGYISGEGWTYSDSWIHNNTAIGNGFEWYGGAGIYLWGAGSINNLIENNLCNGNNNGIQFRALGITNNIIRSNTIQNSASNGIYYTHSAGPNTFYHNNFINNSNHLASTISTDVWDNSYPSGGNYWDTYVGVDDYHGSSQDIPGSDGMGDTPYSVFGGSQDNYPLMGLWGVNDPPKADAGGPYEVDEGTEITFNATESYDADLDELQYRWDIDNDTIWDTSYATDPTATHTWYDDYSGEVVAEVCDGEETDSDTAMVMVNNVAPTVSIDNVSQPFPEFILPNDTLWFNGSYVDPSPLDTHTIEWDFGDGNITNAILNPTHVYANPGSYMVTLTVIDDDGGIGIASAEIIVESPAEATEDIIEDVEDMELPEGINNSLISKLENAIDSIDNDQENAAANKLEAFINQVEAQRGKKLTDEEADALIAAAQWIIGNIT